MRNLVFASFILFSSLFADEKLHWTGDLERAVERGKEEGKPLLIAFVGTSWCPWSQKLYEEVLSHQKFIEKLKEEMVLAWVDFPDEQSDESISLRDRYELAKLPTLVFTDPSGSVLAQIEYLPMDASHFASHIQKLLEDYNILSSACQNESLNESTEETLCTLYRRATELGASCFIKPIMERGLEVENGEYFHIKQYETLLRCLDHKKMAKSLRSDISKRDPENNRGTQRELALVDFKNNRESKCSSEETLRPLIDYIASYGKHDSEHLWEIEMLIASYLFSKNHISDALNHAREAKEAAPENALDEVNNSIDYLNSLIKK